VYNLLNSRDSLREVSEIWNRLENLDPSNPENIEIYAELKLKMKEADGRANKLLKSSVKLPKSMGTDLASIAFILPPTAVAIKDKTPNFVNVPNLFGTENDYIILYLIIFINFFAIFSTVYFRVNDFPVGESIKERIFSYNNISMLIGLVCFGFNYYLLSISILIITTSS
jgi:hypothetical protein